MTNAWYQVLSLSFGYVSAAAVLLFVLLALQKTMKDRRILRRVRRGLPRIGSAGTLRVLTAGLRRIPAGTEIRVPYEGTMGASHSCDVCIPYRKVHLRSAFFWMEGDGLHMAALHRDGFVVDDVPVEPGDEAVLRDGAVLRVGEAKMVLRLHGGKRARTGGDGPYVTSARRSRAQQGRGDGIGAPGKAEQRREKKRQMKQERNDAAAEDTQTKRNAGKRSRR